MLSPFILRSSSLFPLYWLLARCMGLHSLNPKFEPLIFQTLPCCPKTPTAKILTLKRSYTSA
ncbi:unnamed protein product [Schistosoma mansoni]|uniref:Smp_205680 n=1 Tax=Schistosoma mansoni TaxID=6183 RepID=UPI00022C85FF|nr:unnamed protein product [Schistosoma mansoni]|eukprot:XP_018644763.1 unnamed protein product [Schistosoma mansoni]